MDVDPITLEVMRNKLDGIANEMQLTLVRSAFSAIVKEGLDASASLFTLQGETLAQALAIPIHLGALTPMVGRLLLSVPLEQMGEGDIWKPPPFSRPEPTRSVSTPPPSPILP